MFPEHPDIARTMRTGYPYPITPLFCVDCGQEIEEELFISDGDLLCEDCCKERILENYDTRDLARAFDIQATTVCDYLIRKEEAV